MKIYIISLFINDNYIFVESGVPSVNFDQFIHLDILFDFYIQYYVYMYVCFHLILKIRLPYSLP